MTTTAEIVERLRTEQPVLLPGERITMERLSQWLTGYSRLCDAAADHMETLEAARRAEAAIAEEALAARDRAVEALREIRDFAAEMYPEIERGPGLATCGSIKRMADATLAEIDTESEPDK